MRGVEAVRAVAPGGVHDHGHAGVLQHLHARAVGALEDLLGEHLPGRSGPDHLAVEADEVRQVRGDAVEVVGGEEDRDAGRVELAQQVQHLVPQAHVDAGGGLVEQQQLGPAEERPRDEHALLLAARELADVPPAELLETEPREHRGHLVPLGTAGPGQQPPADAGHQDALVDRHREAPVDRLDLGHVGHPQPGAPLDRALRRLEGPEHRAQQRRLAGARGADHADQLAGRDLEIHAGQHGLRAIAAGDGVEPDELGAGHRGHCG